MTEPKSAVLPITPQGSGASFYQRDPPSLQGAVRFLRMNKGTSLRLAVLLGGLMAGLSCAPVRPPAAEFTPHEGGLDIAWSGPPEARFLVFCGEADGPHYPGNDGRAWTTIAADPYGGRVKPCAEGVFDARGAIVLRVPWSDLPADPETVLQGLSFDDAAPNDKARVTQAVVVRGRSASAVVLPHATALLLGPRALGYAALLLALISAVRLRRRLRPLFENGRSRWRILLAIAALAGTARLLGLRDPEAEGRRARELWQELAHDRSAATAIARAVGTETAALLAAVRRETPPEADLDVVAAFEDRMPPVLFRYAEATFPGRRVRAIDAALPRTASHASFALRTDGVTDPANILFRNAAGSLVRVSPGPDSRTTASRPR